MLDVSAGKFNFSFDEGVKQWGLSSFIGTACAVALTGAPVLSGVTVCMATLFADKAFVRATEGDSSSLVNSRVAVLRSFSAIAVSIVAASALGIPMSTALGVAYTAHAIATTARVALNYPGICEENRDEQFGFKMLSLAAVFGGISAICSPAHAAVAEFSSTFTGCMGTAAFFRTIGDVFSATEQGSSAMEQRGQDTSTTHQRKYRANIPVEITVQNSDTTRKVEDEKSA